MRTYVSPLAACDSYVPGEYIVLDDDAGFVVRKNGRDAGHGVIRARMHEIEKGGCRYHSCPNGARTAYWSDLTRGGKYNGSGELLTIDGTTHYTENLMSGKDEGRLLRRERHLCGCASRRARGKKGQLVQFLPRRTDARRKINRSRLAQRSRERQWLKAKQKAQP